LSLRSGLGENLTALSARTGERSRRASLTIESQRERREGIGAKKSIKLVNQ